MVRGPKSEHTCTRTLLRTFFKKAYHKNNAHAYAQGLEYLLFKDKANAYGQEYCIYLRNGRCVGRKAINIQNLKVPI